MLASTGGAHALAGVVEVSIVKDPVSGKPVMQPESVKAADGDTVKICNRSDVIVSLFSYSRFNVFAKSSGKGVRVARNACTSVVVANPTGLGVVVDIRSEIQDSVKLRVAVAPGCKRTTQSTAAGCPKPGTYTFVSATLRENPYGKEVAVNAGQAGSAVWNRCCDGARWTARYTWRFPSTLTPGRPYTIGISLATETVEPRQPLLDQMSALAPGFRQDLQSHYPDQPSASKTYSVPFAEGYATDPNQKELKLYVSFASGASVELTYRRNG